MQLGIGVYLGSVSGAAIAASGASTLLSGETQGLALDFTDDFYAATTGFYGSARIIDTGTPANNYDSSPTTTAASLLTHTSPSLKMTMGPSGTLRFQAHNLSLRSETLSSWTTTRASISADATTAPFGGAQTADLVTEDGTAANTHFTLAPQTSSGVSGATYEQVVYIKPNGRTWVSIQADGYSSHLGALSWFNLAGSGATGTMGAGVTSTSCTLSNNGFYKCTIVATATGTSNGLFIRLATGNNSATYDGDGVSGIYVWGAHLRRTPSDSTYLATTTAARYALPLEWSTAGVLQGMLVEDARTNLLANSQNPAGWGGANFTATSGFTAPDGTATAAKFEATTSAATNSVNSSAVTATSATASIYIKKGSGATDANAFAVRNATTASILIGVTINYDTLAITYTTGASGATLTEIGNGWYRLVMTAASGITSGDSIQFYTCFTGSSETAGEHAYVWGRQLEAGSFATSYIPTIGATATRAVDTISMALPSGIAGASAYTAYVAWIDSGVTVASSRYVYSVRVGADSANRLSVTVASNVANAQIVSANADSLATGTSAVSAAAHKHVLAYDASSGNEAFDGVLKTQDVSITPPVGSLDQMYLGSAGGALALNCHVRQFMIIPRRRGDGELAGMTTP